MAVLVRGNPDHPESLLALARAELDAGLAGEARRHLERARALGVNERRVWSLMADLAEVEGNADAAQEALRHLAHADADPVWRCTACGTQHEAWHPVCDAMQVDRDDRVAASGGGGGGAAAAVGADGGDRGADGLAFA